MAEIPGSILIGVTFLLLEFLFSYGKASDANIVIFANSVCLWKTRKQTSVLIYSHA